MEEFRITVGDIERLRASVGWDDFISVLEEQLALFHRDLEFSEETRRALSVERKAEYRSDEFIRGVIWHIRFCQSFPEETLKLLKDVANSV